MSTLIIVESPSKCKKIGEILGPGYKVIATYGHIQDLDPHNISIDIENNYNPRYKILDGKQNVIQLIKNEHKKCRETILSSDKDIEGEFIAYSVQTLLQIGEPKRMVFNSITKTEIQRAINNISTINMNMIYAQRARRILDRIIGYKLSPIMSKQFRHSLSIGRVISIVVKMLIEKEHDIQEKINAAKSYFKMNGNFMIDMIEQPNIEIKCQLYDNKNIFKSDNVQIIYDIYDKIRNSKHNIANIKKTSSKSKPPLPYTTSSLLQDSKKKFNYTSKTTMMAAQHLYENGYITYMRTDSTQLSSDIKHIIHNYIEKHYGTKYDNKAATEYTSKMPGAKGTKKNKQSNVQEAHEAIRPTNIDKHELYSSEFNKNITNIEAKLYSLIWKTTIASQMTEAIYSVTKIEIKSSGISNKYTFISEYRYLVFDGFLKVLRHYDDDEIDNSECGNQFSSLDNYFDKFDTLNVSLLNLTSTEKYDSLPSRYDDASLIKYMEEKQIGRPSTYSSTIEKLFSAEYATKKDIPGISKQIKIIEYKQNCRANDYIVDNKDIIIGSEKNIFFPLDISHILTEYLDRHFPNLMSYDFTATIEKHLDSISEGTLNWINIVDNFYKSFIEQIKCIDTSCIFERMLGMDNDNVYTIIFVKKKPVIKKMNTENKNCEYIDIHNNTISKKFTIDSITINDAIELFNDKNKYPIDIGIYNEKNILLNHGKYGYYLVYDGHNYSIKNKDISYDEAVYELNNNNNLLGTFNDKNIYLKSGKYGPYINYDNKNIPVKKENITIDMAIQLIESNDVLQFTDEHFNYKIMNGKYGPYIKVLKNNKHIKNVKINKNNKVETLEDVKLIIDNDDNKKSRPIKKFQKNAGNKISATNKK